MAKFELVVPPIVSASVFIQSKADPHELKLVGRVSDDEEKPTTVVYEARVQGVSLLIELQISFQAGLLLQTVPGPEQLSFRSAHEDSPEFAISALFDSASLLDEVLGRDGRESWNLSEKEIQEGIIASWEECQVGIVTDGDGFFRLEAMLPEVVQFGGVEFTDLVVDSFSGTVLYSGKMRGHTVELSLVPVHQATATLEWPVLGREAKLITGYSHGSIQHHNLVRATQFIAALWEDFR